MFQMGGCFSHRLSSVFERGDDLGYMFQRSTRHFSWLQYEF